MSPVIPDPYKVLGVAKDAQIAEIRSAHRKLVLKCHPDKVQDPELKAQKQDEFQKVQNAYEILSDEKERQRYDDQVQLAELRKQMQNKANISVSRSSPKYAEFEVRTAEPSSYKSTSSHMPPNVKVFNTTTYSRSWEDDRRSGPRYHDGAEPARSSRREATYSDRPSKRESEKEREREKEKDRERRKKREKEEKREREEELRRQEKEDKKAREKDKKAREKQRSKEMKRDTESKRRDTDSPYIETWEEDYPKAEKKKSSSSRKHEEKRERSSHRDDPASMPRYQPEEPAKFEPTKLESARAYIQQSQRSGPERTHSYHLRGMPAVPTPPPADTPTFPPPEEEIRRSSARPRPGSGEMPTLSREKSSYQRPSRERLDRDREEPIIVSASPTARHPFPPKMGHPEMSSSPPQFSGVHRTNTMPSAAASTARPIPTVSRSNTFSGGFESDSPVNKGRNRSRKYPQVHEETEYEEDYERRPAEKERKHRSSKKHRSPDRGTETRYHVDNGRAKLYHSSSYSRKLPSDHETFYYDYDQPSSGATRAAAESHPAYSSSNYRVKQSKTYGAGDVQYSTYPAAQTYRGEGYPVYAA